MCGGGYAPPFLSFFLFSHCELRYSEKERGLTSKGNSQDMRTPCLRTSLVQDRKYVPAEADSSQNASVQKYRSTCCTNLGTTKPPKRCLSVLQGHSACSTAVWGLSFEMRTQQIHSTGFRLVEILLHPPSFPLRQCLMELRLTWNLLCCQSWL